MERAEELNLSPVHDSAVLGMSPVECHEVVLDNGNTLAIELEVRVWVGVEEYEGHNVVCHGRPGPCLEVVDVLVRRARDSRQGKYMYTARLGRWSFLCNSCYSYSTGRGQIVRFKLTMSLTCFSAKLLVS